MKPAIFGLLLFTGALLMPSAAGAQSACADRGGRAGVGLAKAAATSNRQAELA